MLIVSYPAAFQMLRCTPPTRAMAAAAASNHLDGCASVHYHLAAHQPICGLHGNAAHVVVTHVLCHLQNQACGVILHLQGVLDSWQLAIEPHVHHWADHLRVCKLVSTIACIWLHSTAILLLVSQSRLVYAQINQVVQTATCLRHIAIADGRAGRRLGCKRPQLLQATSCQALAREAPGGSLLCCTPHSEGCGRADQAARRSAAPARVSHRRPTPRVLAFPPAAAKGIGYSAFHLLCRRSTSCRLWRFCTLDSISMPSCH